MFSRKKISKELFLRRKESDHGTGRLFLVDLLYDVLSLYGGTIHFKSSWQERLS